jgi:FixJ family two-component response regulator
MTNDRHTIAVIDDDWHMLVALERFLAVCGYKSDLYRTTCGFLQAARTTTAKCLIVDCHVGSDSGIQMVRDLAAQGVHYPTIFLTGSSDDDLRNQANALNCVAFLRKPADTARLQEALITAIQRAHTASSSTAAAERPIAG